MFRIFKVESPNLDDLILTNLICKFSHTEINILSKPILSYNYMFALAVA